MKKQILFFGLLVFGLSILSCGKDDDDGGGDPPPDACDTLDVSYSTDIVPIIEATCAIAGCHVADFSQGDFTTYEDLKEKVDDEDKLLTQVTEGTMPPSNTAGPAELTADELELIQCWIDDGAPDN